ncbi:MAG: elongation factor G [Clostridiales bacterium]|jgi:elongation factor G|nr:MAG: elongation factor G [Clostridiales bacterium]
MSYSAQNIRNICLLGHSGVGKTMLVESMLNLTGATDRLGKTADGNTVCDYDAEEIKRQISISTALAPVEFKDCKINVLDTPGNFDFNGDVLAALQVADAAVIVLPAKGDISVGAERAYKEIKARNLPCLIYVSKTDEDNGDFNAVVEKLKEKFGTSVTPLVIPKFEGEKVAGVIDVVAKKAYTMNKNKTVAEDVPADAADLVEESYAALMENVAETSEELMEKFFEGEEFTAEEIAGGLHAGVKEGSLIPVFCGSAFSGLGTEAFMNGVIDLVPDPTQGIPAAGVDADGEAVEVAVADGDPVAFVFKTVSDQYGKYSYIKVLAGPFAGDSAVVNSRTGDNEKLGRLYMMRGKKATEVKSLVTGDIGAIAKMDKVRTNDTLSAKGIVLNPIPFAEPVFSKAISPKTRGQEDKIGVGLNRLNEEDPSFSITNNAETHQMVVAGAGDIQIDVLVSKLKSRFSVEAVLDTPRVPYREKIRKTVSKQGKFKKQTGGSGQYGDVWVRFEPCDEEEMVFAEEVFGGSVPRNYFPAVEKGLREACIHGVLAGYPVVNLKAVLYDGSYHPVDSSEIAFKTAAQLAYKAALPEASPVLMEPVGELKVTVPDNYMGDVMGDLNKRRGRVMGMDPTKDGDQIITAEVPMAEMTSYAIELRAMTQSRGSFTFHFVRYEDCPPAAQQKAIDEAKALQEE